MDLIGPQAEGRSSVVNSQLTVNMYPRVEGKGAKNKLALYPIPGLKTYSTAPAGPCRSNGVAWKGKAYFVSGNRLISIDQNGISTSIGTLDTAGGRASVAGGRNYIMAVDGVSGYSYDGTTFAKITDADFPTADYVAWVNNYFIVNNHGTDQFHISGIDDPTAWSATDFATAERKADVIHRPMWLRGDLLLLGDETSELFYDSGNADFPWEPFPNMILEYGVAAPASAAEASSVIFMLAKTAEGGYRVIKASSETPQVISDRDIEWQIGRLTTKTDAEGFFYEHDGHRFYVLTFPAGKKTFVYDDMNGMWHERQSEGSRWRPSGYVFLNGKHIVGDYNSAVYYEIDHDTYTDAGEVITRIRRAPALHDDRKRLFFHRLELEIEGGVGLVTGQGSDPQIMMRWSDDGARTWGPWKWKPAGKLGEYRTRAHWHNLGSSRNRVFEFRMTDPVKWVVTDAYVDVSKGIM